MELLNSYNSPNISGSNSGAHAATSAAKQSSGPQSASTAAQVNDESLAGQKLQAALENLDLPEIADGSARVELDFNQDTGRVIAKVTDRLSGEILREIPSRELQQLFSQMREYLGSFVDEEI